MYRLIDKNTHKPLDGHGEIAATENDVAEYSTLAEASDALEQTMYAYIAHTERWKGNG